MSIDFVIKYKINNHIFERFPQNRFTIFRIPYIIVNKEINKIYIINQEENTQNVKCDGFILVVFRKFNWSIKNDIIAKSQKMNLITYSKKTDMALYCLNCIKDLMVVIIDENSEYEYWLDESLIKSIDKDIFNGIMGYFFSHNHFDTLGEDDEWELRKSIHTYLSYWRMKESSRQIDRLRADGMGQPVCPSIILKVSLAERFGWTFDAITNLSEKDIKQMQILSSQERANKFESETASQIKTPDDIIKYNKEKNKKENMLNKIEEQEKEKAPDLKDSMAYNQVRQLKKILQ